MRKVLVYSSSILTIILFFICLMYLETLGMQVLCISLLASWYILTRLWIEAYFYNQQEEMWKQDLHNKKYDEESIY